MLKPRGAADQFKISAVVLGEGEEEKKLVEEELRGRMVFPGQLSLLQAVGGSIIVGTRC